MDIVNALCMPAPKGSGIQYTFCGYLTRNVLVNIEHDYTYLQIPMPISGRSNMSETKLYWNDYDRIALRRLTPNVLRLRYHLWLMDVRSYEEGTKVKNTMLECGILEEDVQFNYSGVPLEALNQKIDDALNAGESPEKMAEDIENKYPALMYVMRYSMRY